MTGAKPTERSGSHRRTVAVHVIGLLVAAVAIGLLVHTLADSWPEVRSALRDASWSWLIIGFLCSGLAMLGLALVWWRCLHEFGSPARSSSAIAWYFGGELGKYVPGSVWSVLGRGELAQRGGGISRRASYATTLVAYGVMCAGAAVTCGVLGPIAAMTGSHFAWGWALLALIPAGIAVLHPAVLRRLFAMTRKVSRGRLALEPPRWSRMIVLLCWCVPAWVFLGLASVATTHALGFDQSVPRVMCAAVSAWILGFLAVPVPAGAGVREVLFVAIAGLPAAYGTAVAITSRVLLVLVDGIAGVVGLARSASLLRSAPAPDGGGIGD